jgi:Flp pilus assembly protein TadG
MTRRRPGTQPVRTHERGIALVYVTAALVTLLLVTGLAVDLGRAYVVRSNLATAVDAAALAAARYVGQGQGQARVEAKRMFDVNFPAGYLGVTPSMPQVSFAVSPEGASMATVSATATLPTTFSRVAGLNQLNVAARSQATRRLVDLAFVVDHSGSIGDAWDEVQDATKQFVSYFDAGSDRMSLVLFSTNTNVADPITVGGRGFDRNAIVSHIDATVADGSTATAEALYQAWDQLRVVPAGTQSPLRVVVLFTDGCPNTFSGRFKVNSAPGVGPLIDRDGALLTPDFPEVGGNGDTDNPYVVGLFAIYGTMVTPALAFVPPTSVSYASNPSSNIQTTNQNIPQIPLQSLHPNHASSGIPSGFALYDAALPGQRALVGRTATGYPNHVQNANNAARNLLEIVANAARGDASGAFPIRIFTLGLGGQLNANTGAARESGSSILKRVANDRTSPGFNPAQPEGRYFFAGDPAQLNSAFESVRNQIVRFSE